MTLTRRVAIDHIDRLTHPTTRHAKDGQYTSGEKGKGGRGSERDERSKPEVPMHYDVAFRHQQALDPSALTTIATTLHAVQAAITDCRNAGKDLEDDPAVVLLVRHLGAVTLSRPVDMLLRHACMDQIAEIRRHPALLTLARRGVGHDDNAKRAFHSEGRIAMRRLAEALNLAENSFEVRSNHAGPACSGEITLHGEEVWVQLSLGYLGPDHEVLFRRVRGRADHTGDRNRWASVRDLLSPDRFADRLRRELQLSAAPASPTRLFA